MSSYISALFSSISGLSGYDILAEARAKIIINNRSLIDDNFNDLEEYLNYLYYKKENKFSGQVGFNIDQVQQLIQNYVENQFNQSFNSYSITDSILTPTNTNPNLIKRELYESFSHAEKIHSSTIKNRMQELWNFAENADIEGIEKLKERLVNLKKYLVSEIKKGTDGWVSLNVLGNANLMYSIEELDELYKIYSYINEMPVPPHMLGNIFEKSLQAFSSAASASIDKNVDTLLEEGFKSSTAGSVQVNRGFLKMGVSAQWADWRSKDDIDINGFNISQMGKNFSIKSTFSEKSGKMDVNFTMPSIGDVKGQSFRISAKNWSKINSSHSFGETSTLNALLRSSDLHSTLAYGLGASGDSGVPDNAYEFAKACAIVDIIMGYSQDTGYADTIVVNDRDAGQIKVISIYKLLKNINLKDFTVSGLTRKISSGISYSSNIGNYPYVPMILGALSAQKLSISATQVFK